MLSLEIKSNVKVGMDEVLQAVANLDTPELEDFFQKIAELVVQRKSIGIPNRETELLEKINESALSNDIQQQYNLLYKKLQLETITESEYETLRQLMQKVEQKGVQRLKYLIELATLKNKTLAELMIELKIPSVTPNKYSKRKMMTTAQFKEEIQMSQKEFERGEFYTVEALEKDMESW